LREVDIHASVVGVVAWSVTPHVVLTQAISVAVD